MALTAVDPGKLLALMVLGGLFALAGLRLMFRPKSEDDGTAIEIFGLKFKSSSVGLLVFLVGAAFLAVPLFVTEKTASRQIAGPATNGNDSDTGGMAPANPVPITQEGAEVEPNDSTAKANLVPVGSSVTGSVAGDEIDVFRIDTSGLGTGTLYVTLSGYDQRLQVSLPSGKMIYNEAFVSSGSVTYEGPTEEDAYFARITTYLGTGASKYELTVTAR